MFSRLAPKTENWTLVPPARAAGDPMDRDLRLDACRGVALWFIYLDHIPDNVCSWLTLRHYGFSDTTEVFMFVSGVTCALAYGGIQRYDGWWAVVSHTLRRGSEIYAAFLTVIVALVVLVYWSGLDQFADETNTRILLQQPGAALAHAMILQYRPVNTDVLPVFVLYHISFAPLLLFLLKAPNAALAGSALLYGLVQVYGWNLPQWPRNDWYFNPLAWQFLVVLGAWWVMTGRKRFQPLLTSPPVVALAIAYVLFSLVVALSWSIKPLEMLIPQALAKLMYPIDKSDMDPLRLLHFLALATLVARFVPSDWRFLTNAMLRGAVRCGENSLEIYCATVLLWPMARLALLRVSDGVAAQIAVSLAGILLLTGVATLSTWISIGSRRQPKLL
jgi:hypothetical protein